MLTATIRLLKAKRRLLDRFHAWQDIYRELMHMKHCALFLRAREIAKPTRARPIRADIPGCTLDKD